MVLALHVQAEEKAPAQQAQVGSAPWVVVQPASAPGGRFDTAAVFAEQLSRLLGRTVVVDTDMHGKDVDAFRWSLMVAPQQPSVLLVAEESVLMGASRKTSPAHFSNFEPLLILGFKRWCVFVENDSPLQLATQLRGWLAQLERPVRIALPISSGRMPLWVQGMEYSTQHEWVAQTYGINGDFAAALKQGADLALARCDRLGTSSTQVRALVQSGDVRETAQADIPTFSEAGWLPFEHGWNAFFAPKSISPRERAEMAQALHRSVSDSEQVQKGLKTAGFVPADLSPSASRAHIERFFSGWELVEQFLMGEHARSAWPVKEAEKP